MGPGHRAWSAEFREVDDCSDGSLDGEREGKRKYLGLIYSTDIILLYISLLEINNSFSAIYLSISTPVRFVLSRLPYVTG